MVGHSGGERGALVLDQRRRCRRAEAGGRVKTIFAPVITAAKGMPQPLA